MFNRSRLVQAVLPLLAIGVLAFGARSVSAADSGVRVATATPHKASLPRRPAPAPQPAIETERVQLSDDGTWGQVSAANVNVRLGPGTGNAVIATLHAGDYVKATAKRGSWLEIRWPENVPIWVPHNAIQLKSDSAAIVRSETGARAIGNRRAAAVVTLKAGSAIKVLGSENGWYKLEAPASAYAFIAARYVLTGVQREHKLPAKAAQAIATLPTEQSRPAAPLTAPVARLVVVPQPAPVDAPAAKLAPVAEPEVAKPAPVAEPQPESVKIAVAQPMPAEEPPVAKPVLALKPVVAPIIEDMDTAVARIDVAAKLEPEEEARLQEALRCREEEFQREQARLEAEAQQLQVQAQRQADAQRLQAETARTEALKAIEAEAARREAEAKVQAEFARATEAAKAKAQADEAARRQIEEAKAPAPQSAQPVPAPIQDGRTGSFVSPEEPTPPQQPADVSAAPVPVHSESMEHGGLVDADVIESASEDLALPASNAPVPEPVQKIKSKFVLPSQEPRAQAPAEVLNYLPQPSGAPPTSYRLKAQPKTQVWNTDSGNLVSAEGTLEPAQTSLVSGISYALMRDGQTVHLLSGNDAVGLEGYVGRKVNLTGTLLQGTSNAASVLKVGSIRVTD